MTFTTHPFAFFRLPLTHIRTRAFCPNSLGRSLVLSGLKPPDVSKLGIARHIYDDAETSSATILVSAIVRFPQISRADAPYSTTEPLRLPCRLRCPLPRASSHLANAHDAVLTKQKRANSTYEVLQTPALEGVMKLRN